PSSRSFLPRHNCSDCDEILWCLNPSATNNRLILKLFQKQTTELGSNVWWPFRLRAENEAAEKALVLWLNSTLGLLTSIAHRIPTRGAWIQFKKPTIQNMPVLDVMALSSVQLRNIASSYDIIAEQELNTIVNMTNDGARANIDELFCQVLGIPPLDELRAELAEEPIIKLRPCHEDQRVPEPEDQMQFELL
ncbi:MAG: hypothetical protein ACRC67_06685, partial [Inquilinus sp.]|uniref:hypothetical protein n=1 Tax=Inquilinus sp. TaxID=1932117 RepID=UPI003F37A38A